MADLDIFEGENWIVKGKHKKGPTRHVTVKLVNDMVAHELGHTLNQVIKTAPPGMSAAKHGRRWAPPSRDLVSWRERVCR